MTFGSGEQDKRVNYFFSSEDGLTWEPLVRQAEAKKLMENEKAETLIIKERDGKFLTALLKSKLNPAEDFIVACHYQGKNDLYCHLGDRDLPFDLELEWEKALGASGRVHSIIFNGTNGIYFLINEKGFFRTVDSGRSWEKPISS